jgi:hypothetical protein
VTIFSFQLISSARRVPWPSSRCSTTRSLQGDRIRGIDLSLALSSYPHSFYLADNSSAVLAFQRHSISSFLSCIGLYIHSSFLSPCSQLMLSILYRQARFIAPLVCGKGIFEQNSAQILLTLRMVQPVKVRSNHPRKFYQSSYIHRGRQQSAPSLLGYDDVCTRE